MIVSVVDNRREALGKFSSPLFTHENKFFDFSTNLIKVHFDFIAITRYVRFMGVCLKGVLLLVAEGGRLQNELSYTRSALGEADASTHQLVIQTPRDANASLLHPTALLSHLNVVKAATAVKVELFDM